MLPKNILDRVKSARRVCVFTGAGVSAESGIPTFRDAGGLWENHRAEDLVTPEAFDHDPVLVWRWHAWLQELSFKSQPNAAHLTIAEMDRNYPEFLLITQNIDDLHERGGSKRMVKLHGDIMQSRCLKNPDHVTRVQAPIGQDAILDRKSIPVCPKCGNPCRPDVVWFGELLPLRPLEAAREFSAHCDLFLIVGTSGVVSGGYGFTELAKAAGATVIEVNPEESALSRYVDFAVRMPATKGLSQLLVQNV